MKKALFEYVLRLGDSNLIVSHRLSEMCSRGPMLEEDIALTNFALDHIGQAEALLKYAGELEGQGRSEDDLAYLRPEWEYRNCLMAEQPNTDFAYVITRQFFIDVWQCLLYNGLKSSKDATLAAMGARFHKESVYHRRHSAAWVQRLGLGTPESHARMQHAVTYLWKYGSELFDTPDGTDRLEAAGIVPIHADVQSEWIVQVVRALDKADLRLPAEKFAVRGAHSEHLGHILSEMQYLQRAFPGAKW